MRAFFRNLKRVGTSSHAFARELLVRKEGPLRMITVGRFAILWDGQPGDYRETVSTDEIFGERGSSVSPEQSEPE